MAKATKPPVSRPSKNQRQPHAWCPESVRSASRRAHEQANRRADQRDRKFVWSLMEAAEFEPLAGPGDWLRRLKRWSMALVLLPLCWVTMWTLLSRFSQATLDQAFWKSSEFWYFATGALLMTGWFCSRLLERMFLYLYVLGHELTHVVFVWLHLGTVKKVHFSSSGGYIITNKTNLLIALSPYFVPFWACVAALVYALLRAACGLSADWDRGFYAVLGATWTFHLLWTLWMIPRDQPDLKENGTFLSLVIIYLANLLVLAALFCFAARSPFEDGLDFARDWLRVAATWADAIYRWLLAAIGAIRAEGRF